MNQGNLHPLTTDTLLIQGKCFFASRTFKQPKPVAAQKYSTALILHKVLATKCVFKKSFLENWPFIPFPIVQLLPVLCIQKNI